MKTTTLLLSLTLATLFTFAQSSTPVEPPTPADDPIKPQYGYMSIMLQYEKPLDQMAAANYDEGWGFSMSWKSNDIGKSLPFNFQFGGRMDYSHHGAYRTTLELLEPVGATARYRLTNSVFGISATARIISPEARFRIYADGIVSGRFFSSTEHFDLNGSFLGYEEEDSNPIAEDFVMAVGGAVGVQYWFHRNISIDLRATYLTGSNTTFADLTTATNAENIVNVQQVTAPMSAVSFQAGLTFRLFDDGDDCCNRCDCCGRSYSNSRNTYRNNNNTFRRPVRRPMRVQPRTNPIKN